MKGVKFCCWLIPMDPGCMSIGAFYVLLNLAKILQAISLLSHIGVDEMDDEENVEQKKTVKLYYGCLLPFNLIQLAVGVTIIVATVKRWRLVLRICAIVTILTVLLPSIMVAVLKFYTRPVEYVEFALEFVVALYSALVLFSFAPPPPAALSPVASDLYQPTTA